MRLVDDLARSHPDQLRQTADVERLLGTWWYGLGRGALILWDDYLTGGRRSIRSRRRRVKRLVRRTRRRAARRVRRLGRRQ